MMIVGFVSLYTVLTWYQERALETRLRELHLTKRLSLIVHAGKQGPDTFVHSLALSMGVNVLVQRGNLMPRVAHCTGKGVTIAPVARYQQYNSEICDKSDHIIVQLARAEAYPDPGPMWRTIRLHCKNRSMEVVMPSGRLRAVRPWGRLEAYDPTLPRGRLV